MAATRVVGRDDELGSIQGFLAEVEQGPAALVLSGEAGLGKTILWEAGVEGARERFGRVLSHRSVEAEASLAFGGLSDLLEPVLEEVAGDLPPPRRQALEVALLLVAPGDEPPDPRAIGLAFLDVLRLLAERGPVVVALDDLQWLDSSSALVVPLALRRLRDERVGLLATLRTGPELGAPFELERSFANERLKRLSLSPLSLGALYNLLRERLELELTRPELVRVLETSGGNPFFAVELGRELVRTGARPTAGQALRVPESLHELLGGRLARLPAASGDLLVYAAALARPTVQLVAAAHGDGDDVVEALDPAVQENVIELDDSRVRFAHPLLASICYEQAPLRKRRAVHRALAGAVTDPEERARHLALAAEGPDADAASELDSAAELAAARGATAAAAELSELAAALSPGPEPARLRHLRAADFHRLAGAQERAAAILEQLLAEVPSGVERADVLFALASTRPTLRRWSGSATRRWPRRRPTTLRGPLGSWPFGASRTCSRGTSRPHSSDARAALDGGRASGRPHVARRGHRACGAGGSVRRRDHSGLTRARRGDRGAPGAAARVLRKPARGATRFLMGAGELDQARAILEELEANAAARGRRRHPAAGPLAAEPARVARGSLGAGARAMPPSPTSWQGRPRIGTAPAWSAAPWR